MNIFTEVSIRAGSANTTFYLSDTLAGARLSDLRAAFPDTWTGQTDLSEPDLIRGRLILRDAADFEPVDGVLGFHFDMGGTAEFTPLRTLRGLNGLSTGGEGGTWVIGDTLCAATQHLARHVPLDRWAYLRVDPGVADVTAERRFGR